MSEPVHIEISALAAAQVRTAETWWRLNRPKAPGAIRAELERASPLIALHPQIPAHERLATAVPNADLVMDPRRRVRQKPAGKSLGALSDTDG